MKKTFLVFAVMLFILSIVPAAFAQDATATPEPLSRADADFVIWANKEYVDALQTIGDAFGADYGVTVAVQEYDFGSIDTVLPVAAPAGQGPDIFIGPHDKLGAVVAAGLVAPVDIANPDSFAASALNAFNYAGDYYGIPFSIENVAFFRNTDIVPDAPKTWDEVLNISRDIAKDNGEDFASNKYGFVRMEGDPYHFFPIQSAFGGYVFGFNDDGSYNAEDVGLGNDGSLKAAEFYSTMVKEGLQPPGVDWELMHSMFESGQSAMTITGPWALDRIRNSGIPYAISNIPSETKEGQPFLGVWGFMVNAFSEQQMLAGIFLNEYIATDDGMAALYEANKRPPAWLATASMIDDPDIAAFTSAGIDGLAMPAIPEMAQVWDAWGNAVTLIAQQAEDPDKAFTDAATQVETLITEAANS